MLTYVQIEQPGNEQNFAYDVEKSVLSRIKRIVVDGAEAVGQHDCKKRHTDQIGSSTSFKEPERRSEYIQLGSNANEDLVVFVAFLFQKRHLCGSPRNPFSLHLNGSR